MSQHEGAPQQRGGMTPPSPGTGTFLGIDLGTSEVKLLLMDEQGGIVGTAGAPLALSRPQPLWSEQDPADWWLATEAAVASLRASHPAAFGRVRGIGLSGQMHGAVLLGARDEVLRPAILWNDGRSHAECAELTRAAPSLHEVAGNLAMPGFTAPKLLWVRRHEPAVFDATRTVLLPKDYLRLLLTGRKVSDPSDAAGTLWLDVARRDWSDELLSACGLQRAQMPRIVEGTEPSGMLLPEVARAWGLGQEVVVAGGAGDNAASAVGVGAVAPGDGFISLGTSGVLFVVDDRFRPNADSAVHAFCHAVPGLWHQMSVMLSAASCLRWFTLLAGAENEARLLEEVAGLASAQRDAAPLFLPYLAGERTPHNNPFATGTLHGLRHDTTRGACGYAVLEGVAFGLADGLDALRSTGTQVERLSLVGGGARSPLWAQLIADVLGVEIVFHAGAEAGAALGAARLGQMACGLGNLQSCTRPEVAGSHRPDPARHDALQDRLHSFRRIYRQITPIK
jgi:xylulokinase